MRTTRKLPVGIENFEKLRTERFYYVDKTELIKELLDNWGEVNLFTRPRRFGKSLNMSMLKYFFGYGCDGSLFDGLEIAKDQELCREYMGKFPVISITLKNVGSSLLFLSEALCKHYGQKAILLIDEYDVPLDKARQFGYYDEMMELIRNLFNQAMKGNDSLYFAVMTGCLKIAKESIFTGLNNLKVMGITDVPFDEHFGFTDGEVRDMLKYYEIEGQYETVKAWYDGYRFGGADVYCPWDVINYCAALRENSQELPRAFWINTSGNDIIRTFLKMAKNRTRKELEELVNGGVVTKNINQDLTYRELYANINNLWSVLFTAGYLTQRGEADGNLYQLAIPNLEIRQIFAEQVMEWFQEEVEKEPSKYKKKMQGADGERTDHVS